MTGNLGDALRGVAATGAACAPDAVAGSVLAEVNAELEPAVFTPLAEQEGTARQEGSLFVLGGDLARYPAVARLRDELSAALRAAGADIAGLDQWEPNEVAFQRYPAGALGITAHLDRKRYRYLVAVVTIEGTAAFTHCRDRAGTPLARWQAGPGSVVLLRGAGLGGVEDGRPLHAVAGPVTGRRTSLGLRMNTRA